MSRTDLPLNMLYSINEQTGSDKVKTYLCRVFRPPFIGCLVLLRGIVAVTCNGFATQPARHQLYTNLFRVHRLSNASRERDLGNRGSL